MEDRSEAYRKAEQQFQDLVDEQHRIREKWREETKSASLKFEHIVQEMKAENAQLRDRSDDLSSRLSAALGDNERLAFGNNDGVQLLKHLRAQIGMAEMQFQEVVFWFLCSLANFYKALAREQSVRNDNASLMAQLDHLALQNSQHRLLRNRISVTDTGEETLLRGQLASANKVRVKERKKVAKIEIF